VKVIRAPIREEYIVVRKGLRLVNGRTEIAVRKDRDNSSLHPAITNTAQEDVARASRSDYRG
jgi:hypothetical protein